MIETFFIVSIALSVAIVLWLLTSRGERSWDTPSRSITPTPKEKESVDVSRCDRIIDYLDTIDTQIQQSDRADKTEVREMLFKLKNRWKIIYRHNSPVYYIARRVPPSPHPKVIGACVDRDNLEVKLMDKGIDLKYPD